MQMGGRVACTWGEGDMYMGGGEGDMYMGGRVTCTWGGG